ncbi:MAG: hypothetical protein QM503_12750 [Bacteroidota bacterium]
MKIFKSLIVLITVLFLIVSCGKPTTPESLNPIGDGGYKIISHFQTSAFAQDVLKKDDLCYIAQGEGGLMIANVSDPYNPISISTTSEGVRGYSTKIAMKDSVIYIGAGSFGVTAISVAIPEIPRVTASNLSMKPAKNLHVMGDYLFTAISEQGVKIAKISYPVQPDIRGGMSTSGYAQGIANTADSNYLLVACGEMGLSIFNISDFQEGFANYPLAGQGDTPGYAEAVTVMDNSSIALMACGTSGLQIIDFSDSTNVHIVGSYDGRGYAKELVYNNNKVYLTAETGGLQIIDVTDITNPVLLGLVEMEYALGLDIDDKYIYVADEDDGLIIVSMPD